MYVPHAPPGPPPQHPRPPVRTPGFLVGVERHHRNESGTRRARLEHSLDALTACAARHRDPHTPETKNAQAKPPPTALACASATTGTRTRARAGPGPRRLERRRADGVAVQTHARRPAPPAGNAGEPATARWRLVPTTPPAGVAGASSRVADTSANELRVPRGRDTPSPPPPRAATTRSVGRASEPRERLASFVSPPPPPPAGTETRRASGGGSNESTTAPSPTAPAARSTPSGYLRRSRDRAAPRRLAPGDTGPTLRASEAFEAACRRSQASRAPRFPPRRGRRPAARRSRPRRRRRRRSADRARARRRASPRPCAAAPPHGTNARGDRAGDGVGVVRVGGSVRRHRRRAAPARSADAAARPTTRPRALPRRARKSTRPTATHARVSIMVARSVSRRVIGKKPSLSPLRSLWLFQNVRRRRTTRRRRFRKKTDRRHRRDASSLPPSFSPSRRRAWPRRRVWPRRRTPRHSP